MRLFGERQVRAAIACARAGGQALHLFRPLEALRRRAPQSFRHAEVWAHLFDQNEDRLRATARELGVHHVVIDRFGSARQHVDLCGGPLLSAVLAAVNGGEEPGPSAALEVIDGTGGPAAASMPDVLEIRRAAP